MIQRFTKDGREAFMQSDQVQEAVTRCFEIIGEIVKRLDPALTAQYPNAQWRNFAAFRDVLIHQYDKIDMSAVWESVVNDVAPLKTTVEAMLASLPPDEA